jgi:hypothetical protein
VDFNETLRAQGLEPTALKELVRDVRTANSEMDPNATINLSRMEHRFWPLNNRQMAFARENGTITALSNLPTTKLEQLSKSDSLVKFPAADSVAAARLPEPGEISELLNIGYCGTVRCWWVVAYIATNERQRRGR